MQEAHVYAWTAWAHAMGVEYGPGWGYVFPKNPPNWVPNTISVKAFQYARRHQKRKKGKIPPNDPVRIIKRSSKELRKEWYHNHRKHQSFKSFMDSTAKSKTVLYGPNWELTPSQVELVKKLYSRKPVVPQAPKPEQKSGETRAQYRARLSKQHEEAVNMTLRAKAELTARIKHHDNLGVLDLSKNRTATYTRAGEILRLLGSNVGAPTASYRLLVEARVRILGRTQDLIEKGPSKTPEEQQRRIAVMDDAARQIADIVGSRLIAIDGQKRKVLMIREFASGKPVKTEISF
jgi:hypothetical protein